MYHRQFWYKMVEVEQPTQTSGPEPSQMGSCWQVQLPSHMPSSKAEISVQLLTLFACHVKGLWEVLSTTRKVFCTPKVGYDMGRVVGFLAAGLLVQLQGILDHREEWELTSCLISSRACSFICCNLLHSPAVGIQINCSALLSAPCFSSPFCPMFSSASSLKLPLPLVEKEMILYLLWTVNCVDRQHLLRAFL